jgi:hypothetical protein
MGDLTMLCSVHTLRETLHSFKRFSSAPKRRTRSVVSPSDCPGNARRHSSQVRVCRSSSQRQREHFCSAEQTREPIEMHSEKLQSCSNKLRSIQEAKLDEQSRMLETLLRGVHSVPTVYYHSMATFSRKPVSSEFGCSSSAGIHTHRLPSLLWLLTSCFSRSSYFQL